MKKKIVLFLLILIFSVLFSACSQREKVATISFQTNGGSSVADVTNGRVDVFPYSSKDGYYIEGWYYEESCTTQVNFPFFATDDVVLYAKWIDEKEGNMGMKYERNPEGAGFFVSELNTSPYTVVIPATHIGEPVLGVRFGFLKSRNAVDTFVIGKNVSVIYDDLYRYSSLKRFIVNVDNNRFKAEEEILYDKVKGELYAYPRKKAGDTFTLKTAVNRDAFTNNDTIKTIKIDGNFALKNECFSEMRSLKEIEVIGDNSLYTSNNGILYSKNMETLYCYPSGRRDEEFVVPDGVKEIHSNSLKNALFTTLTLGKDVNKFDDFSYIPNLNTIKVSTENENFSAKDGVLFSKDFTKLVRYPDRRLGEYSIPEGTEKIGSFSFSESAVTLVNVARTVKLIDGYAFQSSANLEKVIFAADSEIEEIKESAFSACKKLDLMEMTSRVPPLTDEFLFDSVSNGFSLVIPSNALAIYQAYWRFASEYFSTMGLDLTTYSVTFMSNGGSEVETYHGVFIPMLPRTTKQGWELEGWYTDENFSVDSKVTFPYIISGHTTLYAFWEPSMKTEQTQQ